MFDHLCLTNRLSSNVLDNMFILCFMIFQMCIFLNILFIYIL